MEERNEDSGRTKLTISCTKRCSLNFIILSTLMMLLLNKIPQAVARILGKVFGYVSNSKAVTSKHAVWGVRLPWEGANTAFTRIHAEKNQ